MHYKNVRRLTGPFAQFWQSHSSTSGCFGMGEQSIFLSGHTHIYFFFVAHINQSCNQKQKLASYTKKKQRGKGGRERGRIVEMKSPFFALSSPSEASFFSMFLHSLPLYFLCGSFSISKTLENSLLLSSFLYTQLSRTQNLQVVLLCKMWQIQ